MKKNIIALVVIFLLSFVGYGYLYYNSTETVTIEVVDKERITVTEGETVTSKYLIFSDSEVFENEDSLIFGKFNSSDFQGKLHVGETYIVTVVGWRVPFLSMYRNIISVE